MAEHGDLDSTEHPSGNRGNHVVYGLNAVADEPTRLAFAQVVGDDGRIIKQTGSPDSGPYMASGVTGQWDYMGAGSPWWKVAQRAQQDFNNIPQNGDQAISIPAMNLSEGIPTGVCMCQIACSLMGLPDNLSGPSALEIFRLTLGFGVDTGGLQPWQRAITTDAGVPVVQQLVIAGAAATLSNLSCSVTGFTQDAATELEFTITDENGAAGAWKAVLLTTRSEFVLLPT